MCLGQLDEIRSEHIHSGIALLEEELLPLAHHAQEVVVHDGDLHIRPFLHGGGQLGGRHLESSVTGDRPDFLVLGCEPGANGRGQTKPHRPRPARRQPAVRFLKEVILRGPHLVLSHVGGHDGIPIRSLPDIGDQMGYVQFAVFLPVHNAAGIGIGFPAVDLLLPFIMVVFVHQRDQVAEHIAYIAYERHIDKHIFVDLRWIDLDVDLLGARCIRFQRAGHAVVKAHTEGKDQVGILDRHVGMEFPVHAHHAQTQFMRSRERAEAEQCARHRRLGLDGELHQLLLRFRHQHAVSAQDDRLFRPLDQFHRLVQQVTRRVCHGLVAHQLDFFGIDKFTGLDLGILADIDQYGTGPAAAGDIEGLTDRLRNFVGAGHKIVVFRDRQRDAGHIGFLEGVAADQVRGHLSRDEHHRDRIHHRRANTGNQIRRTGTRGRHRHADLAGGSRISIRHVRRTLLVPYQHMMDGIIQHRIVDRHIRTARVAKDNFHPLTHQALPDYFCTFFLHCCSFGPWTVDNRPSTVYRPPSVDNTAPVSALVTKYE